MKRALVLATIATWAMSLRACREPDSEAPIVVDLRARPDRVTEDADDVSPRILRRFQAIELAPVAETDTEIAQVALGRRLYHDAALSADGSVSCNSCHDLSRGGVDGQATSRGVGGRRGTRNAPTVFNVSLHTSFFWDGRAESLEEQVEGPLLGSMEMGMKDEAAVVRAVTTQDGYTSAFVAAFGEGQPAITFDRITSAIAAFERTLVARSRWDDYLDGDKDALSREEKRGLRLFLQAGCMVCHTGKMLGGSTFERVGNAAPWPNQKDTGRFEATKNEDDRMMFKVPTLRNVAETGPWFHDGSATTLEQAIERMGVHEVGVKLSPEETGAIAAWLRSLTGRPIVTFSTPR